VPPALGPFLLAMPGAVCLVFSASELSPWLFRPSSPIAPSLQCARRVIGPWPASASASILTRVRRTGLFLPDGTGLGTGTKSLVIPSGASPRKRAGLEFLPGLLLLRAAARSLIASAMRVRSHLTSGCGQIEKSRPAAAFNSSRVQGLGDAQSQTRLSLISHETNSQEAEDHHRPGRGVREPLLRKHYYQGPARSNNFCRLPDFQNSARSNQQ